MALTAPRVCGRHTAPDILALVVNPESRRVKLFARSHAGCTVHCRQSGIPHARHAGTIKHTRCSRLRLRLCTLVPLKGTRVFVPCGCGGNQPLYHARLRRERAAVQASAIRNSNITHNLGCSWIESTRYSALRCNLGVGQLTILKSTTRLAGRPTDKLSCLDFDAMLRCGCKRCEAAPPATFKKL